MKYKAVQLSSRPNLGAQAQTPPEMPVALDIPKIRPGVAPRATPADPNRKWWGVPEIALLQSFSLLLISWAFVQARASNLWSEAFFWIGLAILIVPVAMRLYATETSRQERIALILLLGGAFYLVKVMHSPYAFTFPDEFSNFRNVREILENQRLFVENPELPATALYPGLATVTSLLISSSGLPIFTAGLLVIGAARLVLFLGLFLLYEHVSGSARIGSLATLFYMANANFLFYTAEVSYESLALPMVIFVLYLVVRRETTKAHRVGLTIAALFGVFLVVISHHMSSYILTMLLFAATGIAIVWTRGKQRGPWDLSIVAALATSFWLFYVATYTIKYLSPVFGKAARSVVRLAAQEETGRQLFTSTSTGYVSPVWEQLVVFCFLLILVLGLPVGWWTIWSRHRQKLFFLLLGMVSLAYLPIQALRLTSAGWETANRSSEFLFIGVAFVVALAIDPMLNIKWIRRASLWIQPALVVILIFGGFISGWAPQARMPRPYLVDAGSHIVEPQNVEVAKWTYEFLGPDHRMATSKVGSKLLSAYGEQAPFAGGAYAIKDMLFSAIVGPSEVEIIQKAGIEYIASERRRISQDHMIGLFFLNEKSSPSYEMVELETYEKFDGLEGVHRIMDSGDLVIYDVTVYLETPIEAEETNIPPVNQAVSTDDISPSEIEIRRRARPVRAGLAR